MGKDVGVRSCRWVMILVDRCQGVVGLGTESRGFMFRVGLQSFFKGLLLLQLGLSILGYTGYTGHVISSSHYA